MRIGYISNGFADHSLEQMVAVLSHSGYAGIGLTLDHRHLDPFRADQEAIEGVGRLFADAGLEPVIETGARYYLDAFRKHRPSLVSVDAAGREQRIRYYLAAIDIAERLGARCVSLWSGTPQLGQSREVSWRRLTNALRVVLEAAHERGILIAFEPEPGMFVEDLDGYVELRERLDHPALKLTLDIGHLVISEPSPHAPHIERFGDDIVNVHIEDIADRQHVHLPFGEGDIDFPPILRALERIQYDGLVLVELSRSSAAAPQEAHRSMLFLSRILAEGKP